ncbi:MAG: DUF2187 domain-containing protein [Lactobacillus sp.]|jgi:uncharacterized protein YkvS|nr:DUF2187 domain-containing protein [Lactobacillus sp.]
MKKEAVQLEKQYQCQVKEDMDAPFVGKVEKLYENSALLTITDFNAKVDNLNVEELNHRIVVNFRHFLKEATEPMPKRSEA